MLKFSLDRSLVGAFPGSTGDTFRYSEVSVLFMTIPWQFSNHSFEANPEQSEFFFLTLFHHEKCFEELAPMSHA